ncbi:MAG: hypothetical protein SFW36_07080 [Leptolyngbyaceae cyanobacterium bins.59]|nr:hypothetical protein [Leptolyngbyaceae cyanobacterium bins.59]
MLAGSGLTADVASRAAPIQPEPHTLPVQPLDQSVDVPFELIAGTIAPLDQPTHRSEPASNHSEKQLSSVAQRDREPCFLKTQDTLCSQILQRLPAQLLTEPRPSSPESSPSIEFTNTTIASNPFSVSQTNPTENPLPLQPNRTPEGSEPLIDPELGILRLQELEVQPPPRPQPSVYLLGRVDYLRSSNIFSGIDPIDDNLVRGGFTLWAAPALGPQTYFVASASGNVIRYFNQSQFSYNELLFTGGVYQQLSPRMYGQLSWVNQRLFTVESGEQFLDDHSIRLEVGRTDPIADRLNLDTFYQFRVSFADPSSRSRVINYFSLGLSYDVDPNWQAGLEYQISLTDFTQQQRNDTYQQVLGRLSYRLTPESRINILGGYSFGASSNSTVNFNGSILSVNISFSLPLF